VPHCSAPPWWPWVKGTPLVISRNITVAFPLVSVNRGTTSECQSGLVGFCFVTFLIDDNTFTPELNHKRCNLNVTLSVCVCVCVCVCNGACLRFCFHSDIYICGDSFVFLLKFISYRFPAFVPLILNCSPASRSRFGSLLNSRRSPTPHKDRRHLQHHGKCPLMIKLWFTLLRQTVLIKQTAQINEMCGDEKRQQLLKRSTTTRETFDVENCPRVAVYVETLEARWCNLCRTASTVASDCNYTILNANDVSIIHHI